MTSIIILNMNTCHLLRQCIQSIRTCTKKGSYEIIVVDNGSQDGSVPWILSQPDIRPIINEENLGFPKGCNQGMRLARGKEILLLNSDVVVTPYWLDNMLDVLYSDEKVGAVSCVTNYCSNNQQIKVPEDLHRNVEAIMEFGRKYNQQKPRRISFRRTLVGFCYLFKADLYQKIGELDEGFSPGNFEDDDYSLRILLAGYYLICCEDTFVYHVGSASFIKTPESLVKYKALFVTNEKKFLTKWHLPANYASLTPEETVNIVKNGWDKANSTSVVVVIPIYKEKLTPCEEISLAQVKRVLGKYPIVFVAAEGFKPVYVQDIPNSKVEYFAKDYFKGVISYSHLCLEEGFYARFQDYEYMLLYQLDAFVFEDKLPYFCSMNVDYIGAPIPRFYRSWHMLLGSQVGNGGLSLRKISSVRRVLKQKNSIIGNHPLKEYFFGCEDMFFAYCGKRMDFTVADLDTAIQFALQDDVKHAFRKLEEKLPFGVHGWPSKLEIWGRYIEQSGYTLPDDVIKRHADCRKDAVLDYLEGRNRINLFYLYKEIKWDRPVKALSMLLEWLEHYPKGNNAWQNTSEKLMYIWAFCECQSRDTSKEKIYTYELLKDTIGRACLRSYYVTFYSMWPMNFFIFLKELIFSKSKVNLLSEETKKTINDIIKGLEYQGYNKEANDYRNLYKYLFQ